MEVKPILIFRFRFIDYFVRCVDHQDDQQPDVGEHGENHGYTEHGKCLDSSRFTIRNDSNTFMKTNRNNGAKVIFVFMG